MVGLLAIPLLPHHPLYAQQEEVPQLRQKIAELEAKIERLEALLKDCNDYRKEQPTHQYGWQNKKNWRRLKMGMTESQVKTILGEPAKTIQGIRTLWYYPNIYCGYVSFDKDGRLTGWNEP